MFMTSPGSYDRVLSKVDEYVIDLFSGEDEALRWIQAEADRNGLPQISIRAHEGRMLQIFMKAIGARKAIEIGTLAGYSGIWLARALPTDGKLYTLEKSSKHAAIARASFVHAGVADRVELRQGDALDSLRKLSTLGPFDFVFLDADKTNYSNYLTWTVDNLRIGGIVTAHNALRGGRIIAPESDDDRGMAAFNAALAQDSRLDSTIISLGDGMAMGIKKG
jgi:caffeoyl-CoA O-methyltransferase